ncbi:WD40 repeat domain-containing protein [Kitasatospora sp. MMS16-BH015]|uniref:WD40 repeat domain-containing protein n=1 Tax=Kitasatospora sp. MMS16-BH015 TaxID=2018025 RepID=UPI00131A5538|nr:WD40 repeat domain-containing protein [Kitasatospora sp. MMS16-BH015]
MSIFDSRDQWDIGPDGHLVAAQMSMKLHPGSPSRVGLWTIDDTAGARPVGTIDLPDTLQQVTFVNAITLLTVDHSGRPQLWNISDPSHPIAGTALTTADFTTYPTGLGDFIISTAVTVDKDLATVQGGGKLQLWRVNGSSATEAGSLPAPDPADVAGLLNNHQAVVAAKDGFTWWDVTDPDHPVHVADTPLGGGNKGNVHGSGSVVAAVLGFPAVKNTLFLLKFPDSKSGTAVQLTDNAGGEVALSDDQHFLASDGSGANTVNLWDVRDPAHPRATAAVTTKPGVQGMAFNAGDTLMATWSAAGVQLWSLRDSSSPALIVSIPTSYSGTPITTFTPNSAWLAVDTSSSIRFIDTNPNALATRLCSYTGKAMTPQQWAHATQGLPYQPVCNA